jgi:multidrug efflux pump subunit AcrA (membrane-fusion protein)
MVAEPGTFVNKGDSIARIDDRPLVLRRAEQEALLQRESQLRRQRELGESSLVSEFEIEQTEANRDLAISRVHRAGEDVARGEVLAQMTDIQNMEVRAFVPRDALVLRKDGSYVFRIGQKNKAERIAVEIGDSSGDFVAVSGPLFEGDRVVIRGAENLKNGAKVKSLLSKFKETEIEDAA